MGCDPPQGHWYCKPVRREELQATAMGMRLPSGGYSRAMRTKITLALLALLSGGLPAAAADAAGLRAVIANKSWVEGVAACDSLPATETRRADRRQLAAAHYAELATLCAGISDGAGDARGAGWWWFTALAMDHQAAMASRDDLQARGLLTTLPPPRQRVPDAATAGQPAPRERVTLPSGEVVVGTVAQIVERPRPPDWMFRAVPGVRRTQVALEMVIGEDGVAREPVLVSAQALPLHAFQAFSFLRQWKFAPAAVDGKPVASVYQVSVTTQGM